MRTTYRKLLSRRNTRAGCSVGIRRKDFPSSGEDLRMNGAARFSIRGADDSSRKNFRTRVGWRGLPPHAALPSPPQVFLYDASGSALFDQILRATRILPYADRDGDPAPIGPAELADGPVPVARWSSFGSGSSVEVAACCSSIWRFAKSSRPMWPIRISPPAPKHLDATFLPFFASSPDYPWLKVQPVCGHYMGPAHRAAADVTGPPAGSAFLPRLRPSGKSPTCRGRPPFLRRAPLAFGFPRAAAWVMGAESQEGSAPFCTMAYNDFSRP